MFVHCEGAIFRPLNKNEVQYAPIFLIGFMCSGKTRIGRELAVSMRRKHVDIDRAIEGKVGPLLPFFEQKGEAEFRRIEAATLAQLVTEKDLIVSCGGGTPITGDNLQLMLRAGTVIWLDVPFDVLMPRIERAGGDRPLLSGLKGDALRERVKQLLTDREPTYAKAHMIVQAADEPATIAMRIRRMLDLQAR